MKGQDWSKIVPFSLFLLCAHGKNFTGLETEPGVILKVLAGKQ